MINHKLLPKHGEKVYITEANSRNMVKRIYQLQQDASLNLSDVLATILINDKTNLVMLPCKQCVLNTALQFHDLSEALKELVDVKSP